MKVYNRDNPPVEKESKIEVLTWGQIRKQEGVYRGVYHLPGRYFLVLTHGKNTSVLLYDENNGTLEPTSDEIWALTSFYRVENAEVFFAIKEK